MSLFLGSRSPYSHLEDEDDLVRQVVNNRRVKWQQHLRLATGIFAAILAVTVVLAVGIISLPTLLQRFSGGKSNSDHTEIVFTSTNCGLLVGEVEEGAYVFKGIPYAKPPVGNLRWRKPIPLWTDSQWCSSSRKLNSRNFGPPCFQLNPYTRQYEGSENCLYLNIWTPTLQKDVGLNVMVWIHGGFLQFGSGHQLGLSPSGRLSKQLNTVFISFNYRLHALGFLALDLLEPDEVTYGNYGFWDQVEVLRWVSSNVHFFGGDSNKVTVFGADVGAASTLTFMTSSLTRNLFNSAWLIGPSMIFNRTLEDVSRREHAIFLKRTGCGYNADCLRRLTAKEVINTYLGKDDPSFRVRDQNDLPIQGIYPEQFCVIDGKLITGTTEEIFQFGHLTDVPLLIGTGAQAVDVWPGPDDIRRWSWTQYKKYVTTSLDSFKPRVSELALRIYNASLPIEIPVTPEYVYTTMVSDVRQTCPVNELSELLAGCLTSPVYRYIISSKPSKPARIYDYNAIYSFHLWDVVSFFDKQEFFVGTTSKEDLAFRDSLQQVISNFVRSTGASTGISGWSKFPKSVAVLSENITIQQNYSKMKCKFWKNHGFHVYTWVS